MGSAICGGARYVIKVERDETLRWCFGERRRRAGRWELRSDTPPDEPSWYEPIWLYRCDGCDADRRQLG